MRKQIMRTNTLLICAAGAALFVTSLALAGDSFGAKPGLWEMTSTTSMAGMPMPAMDLDNLPPAARARIEASMGRRAAGARSTTTKSCVTQKDLDENHMIKQERDSGCTGKLISKTTTSTVMQMSCPPPTSTTSRISVQSTSPTALTGTIDMTRPDGFKMHIDLKGRWLGASCAGIKD
jgi:hypothetical protein